MSNILDYKGSSSEEELQQVISQESEEFSMKSGKDFLLTLKLVIKLSCKVDDPVNQLIH